MYKLDDRGTWEQIANFTMFVVEEVVVEEGQEESKLMFSPIFVVHKARTELSSPMPAIGCPNASARRRAPR